MSQTIDEKNVPDTSPIDDKHPPSNGKDSSTTGPGDGPSSGDKEYADYVTGYKFIALLGAVTVVFFLVLLDQTIISTATPAITADLNALSDIGWYAGAYQLTSGALQPLAGKLYTYLRTKWTFLFFLFLFELGSLVCGVAKSSSVLIGGRAIAGAGAAGLTNGGLTIISVAVPLEKRPLQLGILFGVGQLGLIVAPLIGGALTQYVTWRWCFYINLPIGGFGALLLILIHIPDNAAKEPFSFALVRKILPKLDLFGFALFAPASTMFLLALQFGADNNYAWNSSVIIGLFVGAGVTGILFVLWERRVGDIAMIPGAVVKHREVWSSCGNIFCLTFVVFIANFYLPVYFQAVKGVGPSLSGVYLLPGILSQLLLVVLSGAAVSKLGYYMPWSIFSGALTSIGGGLASTFRPNTSTGKWIGYQILQGAGRGAGMQMALISTQNTVGTELIPIAMSLLIFSQNLAGAIAVVIATTIFAQSLLDDLPRFAPSVSPAAAVAAGSSADSVRALVPPGSPELHGLLLAFSYAVDKTFYLVAAFGVAALGFGLLMGWKDVRKKDAKKETSLEEGQDKKDSSLESQTEKNEMMV
ncbi:major facilitator superfamily domain-containing protein [Hypoxylon argillaceum]|nr:major facilitator superfamily domain-containing protein [Hypoxylon argillaceum]